jgi:hypothetical protein
MDVAKYSAATALIVAVSLLPLAAGAEITRQQVRKIARQEIAKAGAAGPKGAQKPPGLRGPQRPQKGTSHE